MMLSMYPIDASLRGKKVLNASCDKNEGTYRRGGRRACYSMCVTPDPINDLRVIVVERDTNEGRRYY